MEAPNLQTRISEALRYWEPRRILYNAVLVIVVLAYFFLGYPQSKQALTINEVLLVFLLAVVANVAYCAAYLPDIFVLSSASTQTWRKYRWIVFVTGVAFAAVITRFIAMFLFGIPV